MALKLDEDYNGSTLLSSWWQKVKKNFAAVVSAINATEAAIDKNTALIESEATAREQSDANLRQVTVDLAGEIAELENKINDKQDASFNYSGYISVKEIAGDAAMIHGAMWGANREFAGLGEVAFQVSDNTIAIGDIHNIIGADSEISDLGYGDTLVKVVNGLELHKVDWNAYNADKANKQDITKFNQNYTISDVVLTPADNNEYLYGELASLALTFEAPVAGYATWIAFTSGMTATEMKYDSFIKWSGDDVLDNVFMPLSNKRYNIGIWYDGANMNAAVRGVGI